MAKKLEGAGLRGQVAGQTSLSTVGKEGHGLTYRGYAIEDLADKAKFEEVAYLLLYGHLPNKTELEAYQQKLISNRKLPEELKKAGISIILHPLSAFRAMSKAALEVYSTISEDGNVEKILEKMQSRDELYEILDYHTYEKKIDDLFSKE